MSEPEKRLSDLPWPWSVRLGEEAAEDYEELAVDGGKVRIWHIDHRIGVFESSGVIHADHANFVVEFHRKHIEAHERPFYSFGNWSHLDAYTPDVRRIMTDWQLAMRYEELHVSHDSRILQVSIAAANAVLPTKVQVHRTEDELDAVFLTIRRRHGL